MADIIQEITLKRHKEQFKKKTTKEKFNVGDTITVSAKVREGEKERIQAFRGIVIKIQGMGMGRSFTVRKVSAGVGVERTFPVNCPSVDDVKVETKGSVRRARLFFLRELKGKAARVNSKLAKSMGIDTKTIEMQEAGIHPVEAESTTATETPSTPPPSSTKKS